MIDWSGTWSQKAQAMRDEVALVINPPSGMTAPAVMKILTLYAEVIGTHYAPWLAQTWTRVILSSSKTVLRNRMRLYTIHDAPLLLSKMLLPLQRENVMARMPVAFRRSSAMLSACRISRLLDESPANGLWVLTALQMVEIVLASWLLRAAERLSLDSIEYLEYLADQGEDWISALQAEIDAGSHFNEYTLGLPFDVIFHVMHADR